MGRAPTDAEFTAFATNAWPGLYRTAYLMLGDHALAEDLVQTALAKSYAGWHRVREADAAYGYARTVLLNTAASWFRRKGWRNEISTEHLPERAYDVEPSDRPALMSALAELPPRQRAAVVLRFYEDLSVEQTATALGCSTGTVKSQTSEALSKLRLLLGDLVLPEGANRD